MTKSYVLGWYAALFALGLVMTNASAVEQSPAPPAELLSVTADDERPDQDREQQEKQQGQQQEDQQEDQQEHDGLPLFPLIDAQAGESQSIDESANTRDESAAADETPAVVVDNLVELVEEDAGPREFVIFVVRHMEKDDSTLDPGLTPDGVRRADALAQLLSTAEIERIYSTLYRRSAGTALPLARTLTIPVEFYQADSGDDLVNALLDAGQSALVVGHSNTVADLVNGLGGSSEELSEESYGDIFQLVIRIDGDDHDVRQVHLKAPLIKSDRRGTR